PSSAAAPPSNRCTGAGPSQSTRHPAPSSRRSPRATTPPNPPASPRKPSKPARTPSPTLQHSNSPPLQFFLPSAKKPAPAPSSAQPRKTPPANSAQSFPASKASSGPASPCSYSVSPHSLGHPSEPSSAAS